MVHLIAYKLIDLSDMLATLKANDRPINREKPVTLYISFSILGFFAVLFAAGAVMVPNSACSMMRLSRSPLFRRRLQRVPLALDHPYWVDDEHFDLEYHVRHIALPKPGDWRQFCIQAARIHARPLDMSRPLWEIYVVEGLDSLLELPAGSFALQLTKAKATLAHVSSPAYRESLVGMLGGDPELV